MEILFLMILALWALLYLPYWLFPEKKPKLTPAEQEADRRNSIRIREDNERKITDEKLEVELITYKKNKIREFENEVVKRIQWFKFYALYNGKNHVNDMTGIEFEKYIATLYNTMGYSITLTPSSGDYGADIIVMKNNEKIAIQTKRQLASVGVKAVYEVLGGKGFYKCKKALVITNSSFTTQAKNSAKVNLVQLIDGQELSKLANEYFINDRPKFINSEFGEKLKSISQIVGYPNRLEIQNYILDSFLLSDTYNQINNTKYKLDESYPDYQLIF